jgi:hypothetical protein
MADTLDRVRASCAAALSAHPDVVTVDAAAAARFASTALPALLADPALRAEGVDFPLVLTTDEGIDLTTLFCLLQFGSGYRAELHAAVGAGASDTLLRGLLCFSLGGKQPTAGVLSLMRVAEVAEMWAIPRDADVPVGPHLPGVTISKPGPLAPLAERIAGVLTGAGGALAGAGAATFSALFRARAADWRDERGAPRVARFVGFLAGAFKAFRDVSPLPGGGEVWLLKKAQLCARELGRKYGGEGGAARELFGWPPEDERALTVFADNVLPAVLRAEGVLALAPALAGRVDAGEAVTPVEGALLRAAAVVAGAAICEAARGGGGGGGGGGGDAAAPSEARLDALLWKAGKAEKYRGLRRHAEKDTVFY